MISKAEREHINSLKQWSIDCRKAFKELESHPVIGVILKRFPGNSAVVFDNVDWLIALLQREFHTQGVKNLLKAVEDHERVHK